MTQTNKRSLTIYNLRKLSNAVEKLEQSKSIIYDLMIESEESESENYDFIEELNNYSESIQSIIDTISDDNDLLEDNKNKTKEEIFKEKAEELGYEVKNYSGRGMFGRNCPSVTVDNVNDFIAEIGMKGLKFDNMGLQYVVYTG